MDKLHIAQGTIHFGEQPLGSKEILADPGEFRGCDGVQNDKQLPGRIDLVFAVGERVAAGEMKFPADLVTSHQRRRLQRQLRYIRQVADIGILFLRGFDIELVLDSQRQAKYRNQRYKMAILWQDLAGFQTQGGYVLHLPEDDEDAMEFIRRYQQGLSTSGARIFAGTDIRSKATGPGKLLQTIPGIGPKMAARLMAEYGTPIDVGREADYYYNNNNLEKKFGPAVTKKLRAAFGERI